MAQVAITFNKRTYRFDCADADAPRLEKIAAYLKDKLDVLIGEHGTVGDERLMLMAALMVTDELFEARAGVDERIEADTDKLKDIAESAKAERATVEALRKSGG